MEKMRNTGTRPLTDKEKTMLMHLGNSLKATWDLVTGTAFIAFVFFGIGVALWKWLGPDLCCAQRNSAILVISAIALGLSLYFFTWPSAKREYHPDQISRRKLYQQEFAEGVATTEEMTVTEAYELPELEDEGVGFFLGLDDGRVLFVRGQDLYEHAHDYVDEEGPPKPHTFPSTRVLYSYGPKTGLEFSIEPLGEFLKPGVLQKIEYDKYRPRNEYPEASTFYDGSLEDVLKRFKLVPAKDAAES